MRGHGMRGGCFVLVAAVAITVAACSGGNGKPFGGGADSGGAGGAGATAGGPAGGAPAQGGAGAGGDGAHTGGAGSGGVPPQGGAPGHGGSATGGTPGSGGVAATGGSTAQGGHGGRAGSGGGPVSTGGVSGLGGVIGVGGVPVLGSGGRMGTGGVAGTGGVVGSGGTPGTGGAAACAMIATMYDGAVNSAKGCPLNSLVNPCTYAYPSTLACANACDTYVADRSTVDTLLQKWNSAGCSAYVPACAACTQPGGGACQPSAVTTQAQADVVVPQSGRCVDSSTISTL